MDWGCLHNGVQRLLRLLQYELGLGENGAGVWDRVDRVHYERGGKCKVGFWRAKRGRGSYDSSHHVGWILGH